MIENHSDKIASGMMGVFVIESTLAVYQDGVEILLVDFIKKGGISFKQLFSEGGLEVASEKQLNAV